ncbi:MAG: hypothetical protein AAGB22_02115 [Bacteroidota bacterium]
MGFDAGATIPPNATEEQMVDALMPLFQEDAARFNRAVVRVKQLNRQTRPLFPGGVSVASVPPVPPAEKDAFKARYISSKYLPYESDEANLRLKSNGRPEQYARWRWALNNLPTYINMLREYGHPDDAIERMLDGVPMCFKTRADYDGLRAALRDLAPRVAAEMDWGNVGFVVTGSSVPGFSQNPLKGIAGLPSKITDPTSSDVDICVVADGVNVTVAQRLRANDADKQTEPRWSFPTTASEITNGMRYGCKDVSKFSTTVGEFYDKWSQILPGGLQITFCEDDTDLPPWESRIDIDHI